MVDNRKLKVIKVLWEVYLVLLGQYPCSADNNDLEIVHLWESYHVYEIRVHCFEENGIKERQPQRILKMRHSVKGKKE